MFGFGNHSHINIERFIIYGGLWIAHFFVTSLPYMYSTHSLKKCLILEQYLASIYNTFNYKLLFCTYNKIQTDGSGRPPFVFSFFKTSLSRFCSFEDVKGLFTECLLCILLFNTLVLLFLVARRVGKTYHVYSDRHPV